MSFWSDKRKRKICIWIVSVVAVLALLAGACIWYVNDYYRADTDAIAAFSVQNPVDRQVYDDYIVYTPENPVAGLIFYPGGKVEHTAYEPLMLACADRGVLCVLVEMPFRLAVLDINAADGICEKYPQIKNWYMGGHSLGGSMAASYIAKHTQSYQGLILLGAYSTEDLSGSGLKVLSVYGSEDQVLNRKKYSKNKGNLPKDFTELIIDGGCHAYFGMYGAQDGDGSPTISNTQQIHITADAILDLILH